MEDSVADHLVDGEGVARGELGEALRDATGRPGEALAIGVLADPDQELVDEVRYGAVMGLSGVSGPR